MVAGLTAHNSQDNQLKKADLPTATFLPEKVTHELHLTIGGNLLLGEMIKNKKAGAGVAAPPLRVVVGMLLRVGVKEAVEVGEQFRTIGGSIPMGLAGIGNTKTGLRAVGIEKAMMNLITVGVAFREAVQDFLELVQDKTRIFPNGPTRTFLMLQTLAVGSIPLENLVAALKNLKELLT